MQFPISALVLSLLTSVAFAGPNKNECIKKNPNVVDAINAFCSKGFTVPSNYAKIGKYVGANGKWKNAQITIDGDCSPPQWVPRYWCYTQLFQMCAKGGRQGENVDKYWVSPPIREL